MVYFPTSQPKFNLILAHQICVTHGCLVKLSVLAWVENCHPYFKTLYFEVHRCVLVIDEIV